MSGLQGRYHGSGGAADPEGCTATEDATRRGEACGGAASGSTARGTQACSSEAGYSKPGCSEAGCSSATCRAPAGCATAHGPRA